MTTEMGPRDATALTLFERLAARSTHYVVRGMDVLYDGGSIRFNDSTATLSISGESDYASDSYERGQLSSLVAIANSLTPVALIMLLTMVSVTPGSLVAVAYFFGVLLPVALFGIFNVHGSVSLISKIDVIDHTTEPEPEALVELQSQFVDGEIEQAEFEARVEEVWERE